MTPRRGEVWWVRLNPTEGSEITARPGLASRIVSTNVINARRRTVVVVPLSTSPQPSPPLLIPLNCAGRESGGCDRPDSGGVAKERLQARLAEISAAELEAVAAGNRRILEIGWKPPLQGRHCAVTLLSVRGSPRLVFEVDALPFHN